MPVQSLKVPTCLFLAARRIARRLSHTRNHFGRRGVHDLQLLSRRKLLLRGRGRLARLGRCDRGSLPLGALGLGFE
jgi:hypothetical protein